MLSLKVHKIEIFFGFDFEICNISLLVMSKYLYFAKFFFDWASIGGGTIFPRSLKLRRRKKNFEVGILVFFQEIWVSPVCLVCFELVCFACFASIPKQRVSMF